MLRTVLPLALVLVGCERHVARVVEGGELVKPATVHVSPVVFVQDLPGVPVPDVLPVSEVEALVGDDGQLPPTVLDPAVHGAFLRNDFVGNIRFGGGFVRTGAVALETRGRLIEPTASDALRAQAVSWLTSATTTALAERHVAYDTATAAPAGLAMRWQPVRGEDAEDGHDNLNLPRTTLVPLPIDPGAAGAWLVPYVRAYYTHNGGWFLGQRWGCMAGARVDVELVLYQDGRPTWWLELTGRSIDERTAQATTAELDQHLLNAEDQVEAALRKGLFR